jgi:hypothetical protein
MRKMVTPVERIDKMLASYAELDREAHDLMDLHIAECRLENPGIPFAVLKQYEFTNRAGCTLNVPAALRLLRNKFRIHS